MATTVSGLLFTWGLNVRGQLGIGSYKDEEMPQHVQILSPYNIVDMSASRYHSAAVSECGKLFTWGYNPDCRLLKKCEYYA